MSVEGWYQPRIAAVNPTGRRIRAAAGKSLNMSLEVEPYQCLPERQVWQRRSAPILSAAEELARRGTPISVS